MGGELRSQDDIELLYHCFPRLNTSEQQSLLTIESRISTTWYRQLCREITESIFDFGFLLNREDLAIDTNEPNPKETCEHDFLQIRCCLTLSSRRELQVPYGTAEHSHRFRFGDIALGIRPELGRLIGAAPCYYFFTHNFAPDSIPHATLLRNVDYSNRQILKQLSQIEDILLSLAAFEAVGRELESPEISSKLPTPENILRSDARLNSLSENESKRFLDKIFQSDVEKASELINSFDFPREPAFHLAGKIEILKSYFQNLDAVNSEKALLYFSEKEWRIVRALTNGTMLSSLNLSYDPFGVRSEAELKKTERGKEKVRGILESRFGHSFNSEKLDDSWFLWGYHFEESGQIKSFDVFDFISEIVVPKKWQNEYSELVAHRWNHGRKMGPKPEVISWTSETKG